MVWSGPADGEETKRQKPGSKIKNSFIHAVSGGGIKQKLAEKR